MASSTFCLLNVNTRLGSLVTLVISRIGSFDPDVSVTCSQVVSSWSGYPCPLGLFMIL